jgi:uncharacterized protein (TIRG00374 family)
MPARYRKYLEFFALLLLAIALVWWFGRKLDWGQVKGSVEKANWLLILSGGVTVLGGYFCRAIRWKAFLKPLTEARLREIWIATTVGYAAVLLIGRAGELVRPVVLPMRDRRVRPAASFVTIFIERVYDSITILLCFAASLLWFSQTAAPASEFVQGRKVGLLLIALLIVVIGVLIWFRWRSQAVIGWIDRKFGAQSRLLSKFKRGLLSILEQLATALGVLSSIRALSVTVGWTLLLWFSVVAGNLMVFWAFGLPFGFSQALFVLGWSMIGSAIPTPGGAAGAFHAVTGAALVLLGVARDQAAAVAIVLHLVDFAPGALFGLFYFLRGEINVTRLRSLISASSSEKAIVDGQPAPSAQGERLEVAAANE